VSDLHGPSEPLLVEADDVELLVKHRGSRGVTGTRYVVPTHPFDVVGWDGCLYPYTFNIADHANVDSDEVMFYCGGDYEARKGSGIGPGSISLHPCGHSHGPQPGAVERSLSVEFFDELAVMVDTFRPLELGEVGFASEDPGYAWTWSGRRPDR
jgi:homogentisate 1,2-dioxygenase